MVKKEKEEKEVESELLSLDGVGAVSVEKLSAAGITTLMGLAVNSPKEIATLTGMTEAKARAAIQQARDSLKLGFEVASSYEKKRNAIHKITTGCGVFDSMIGGGFESGCITEVYGGFGVGKTQLAHLLVVRALLEDKNNKAIMLDTENTFRADRIRDFAKANGVDEEDALSRIFVARAFNSDHQMLMVDEVERLLQREKGYRILVVDSLTSHFRAEYSGRGTLAVRQQRLNEHMHKLLKLADLYNLVVLVTNQVSASPGVLYGDPTVPVGGNIVGHSSTVRIYMRYGKEGSIYAKLVDSPNMPQSDCNYYVTRDGFEEEKPK